MIGDIHFLSKTIQCRCNHKLNGHTHFMYFWYALCFKWPQIKWWPSGHYHNSQYLMMSSNYFSNLSISIHIILSHFVGAHTFPGGLAIVVRTYLRFITPARHDDVIKWMTPLALCAGKSPVNSPQRGQWHGDLIFSLICAWASGWVNNRDVGDLRRNRAHYAVTVMFLYNFFNHVIFAICFAYAYLSNKQC